MKVSSLKQLENYLYSYMIAPLKELVVDFRVDSPLKSPKGHPWHIVIKRTPVGGWRRNYQRDRMLVERDYQIMIETHTGTFLLGTYFLKGRRVELYKEPFMLLRASILMASIQNMLDTHTPFTKVVIKRNAPEQPTYTQEYSPSFDEHEEEYDE